MRNQLSDLRRVLRPPRFHSQVTWISGLPNSKHFWKLLEQFSFSIKLDSAKRKLNLQMLAKKQVWIHQRESEFYSEKLE